MLRLITSSSLVRLNHRQVRRLGALRMPGSIAHQPWVVVQVNSVLPGPVMTDRRCLALRATGAEFDHHGCAYQSSLPRIVESSFLASAGVKPDEGGRTGREPGRLKKNLGLPCPSTMHVVRRRPHQFHLWSPFSKPESAGAVS
jgi:hypothetical protein